MAGSVRRLAAALVLGTLWVGAALADSAPQIKAHLDSQGGPVRDFYAARNFQPAWPNGEALLTEARLLAQAEGLTAESYHAAPGASLPDLAITEALLRLGRDIAGGRVTPSRPVGGMGAEHRPAFDPLRYLNDLSLGKPLSAVLAGLSPRYVGYHRLKELLERYRAQAKAGGWPTIPDGPSIKPGQDDDRVPALRKRLIATRELDARFDKGRQLDQPVASALRKFQIRHGIDPDGAVGKQTLAALNVSIEDRIQQIEVNLERWRWMPRSLDHSHIAVNIPAAHMELVKDGEIQMAMRVVVGDVKHPTPTMLTTMNAVVLNPTWTVPPSIATKEILPKLKKDPGYLASNNMQILDAFPDGSPRAQGVGIDWNRIGSRFPWRLRQAPGPDNALGQVKFNLTNQDDIYLHDTPKRQYFGRIFRALSHGCVRVERPQALAEAVVPSEWKPRIEGLLAEANTKTIRLEQPLTVYLMYMTAWADEDGTPEFRDDFYGHDGRLKAAVKRTRNAP